MGQCLHLHVTDLFLDCCIRLMSQRQYRLAKLNYKSATIITDLS